MTTIDVLSRTQRIVVDSTRAVSVINAGPPGPAGLDGLDGEPGPPGGVPIEDFEQEVEERQDADTNLENSLNQEILLRQTADTNLLTALANEISERESEDSDILVYVNEGIALLQTLANKNVPNGYAGLDAGGLLNIAQIPDGIARDSEVTTAVQNAINALINGASSLADTFAELEGLLGDQDTALQALLATVGNKANSDASNIVAATWRSALGLVIGTDIYSKTAVDNGFQLQSATLTALSNLATTVFGRGMLEAANASAGRALLGLIIGTDIYSKMAVDDLLATKADTTSLGTAAFVNTGLASDNVITTGQADNRYATAAQGTNTRIPTDGSVTFDKLDYEVILASKVFG